MKHLKTINEIYMGLDDPEDHSKITPYRKEIKLNPEKRKGVIKIITKYLEFLSDRDLLTVQDDLAINQAVINMKSGDSKFFDLLRSIGRDAWDSMFIDDKFRLLKEKEPYKGTKEEHLVTDKILMDIAEKTYSELISQEGLLFLDALRKN